MDEIDRPRGLADVIQEIANEQRSRGFSGRSREELDTIDTAQLEDDVERERELNAARCQF